MNGSLLARMALTFGSLSVVSIGGVNALLPELRRQTVDLNGWMSDAGFAKTFAIATAAPGPNVIVVSLIGWRVAGLPGLLAATLAIAAPSCAICYLAARAFARWPNSRALARAKRGLAPLALGLILASGVAMARLADTQAAEFAITAGAAAFVIFTARNPLWALAFGALAMIAVVHAGA